MSAFKALDRVLAPLSWLAAALVAVLLFAGPALIGAKEEGAAAKAAAAAQAQAQATATASATPAFPDADATATGNDEQGAAAPEETPAATAAPPAADGRAVFASAGCGSCHTFQAAGSSGVSGPDLDAAAPDAASAEAKIRSGGGIMPAFEGQLSDAEIAAVAAFVSGG